MRTRKTLLLIFSFLFLFFTQLLYLGNNLDFYWNFNNSLQISNGLVPYNDINIITTPLFHFIVSIFLTIFGKNIMVYAAALSFFKIVHLIIILKIVVLLCKKNTEKNKYIMYTFLIFILLMHNIYYEYNFLSILFISLISYIELLNKKTIKNELLIGILVGLSFLSKQSIGMIAIIFILLKPILFNNNKKNVLYRFLGLFIIGFLFTVYLLFTNSLDSFKNYAVLGLIEFKNNISFLDSINTGKSLLSIGSLFSLSILLFMVFFLLKQFYLIYKNKYELNRKVLLYYSLTQLL